MIALTYTSTATSFFKSSELFSLLQQARVKNEQFNITGILLYQDRNFLQVIEGDDTFVRKLYRSITGDPRHSKCKTVLEHPIRKRQFAGWPMAFVNCNSTGHNAPIHEPELLADPERLRAFLLTFRDEF